MEGGEAHLRNVVAALRDMYEACLNGVGPNGATMDRARRALDKAEATDPYGGEECCPDAGCDKGWGHDGPCTPDQPARTDDGRGG